MIVLDKVTKKFAEHTAIKDVSLTFDKRETIVIIGPSGISETTLDIESSTCSNDLSLSGSVGLSERNHQAKPPLVG